MRFRQKLFFSHATCVQYSANSLASSLKGWYISRQPHWCCTISWYRISTGRVCTWIYVIISSWPISCRMGRICITTIVTMWDHVHSSEMTSEYSEWAKDGIRISQAGKRWCQITPNRQKMISETFKQAKDDTRIVPAGKRWHHKVQGAGIARGNQGYTLTCEGGLTILKSRMLPLNLHIWQFGQKDCGSQWQKGNVWVVCSICNKITPAS